MTIVRLDNLEANAVLDIVEQLRKDGLKQHVDFDWAFHPGRWDPMTGNTTRHANFKFYKDAHATWFNLQHGGTAQDIFN